MKVARHLGHSVVVGENERDLAHRLISMLEESKGELRLVTKDGRELQVPEPVTSAIAEAARIVSKGDSVVVLPVQSELSPQQAARLLNVSRPYLIRLLDQGEIPFHRVGSHRRIVLSDLLAYKEQRGASRRDELRELSKLSREMGIPE